MNIIFVSNNMAKAKTLSTRQTLLILFILMTLPVLLALAFILPQPDGEHHGIKALLPSPLHFSLYHKQNHLDVLALQLSEMQAHVMRLDALSDRLERLSGVKQKDIVAYTSPGRGGPQVSGHGLSETQLQKQIADLSAEIELHSDQLGIVEALLLQQNLQKNTFPSTAPVQVGYNSSSYGWRIDPFTGKEAFHEGLDFTAAAGTPIYAAASGIVTVAEQTPDYGKIIKINHGSGIETRYAHTSLMLVKAGDKVEKGQLIAQVGNTGRSTGAHLHFEVRLNGAPLDPRKYLQAKSN